jgi:hypothetical protein
MAIRYIWMWMLFLLTLSSFHKRQSRMDNPETLEILGTRRGRKRIEVLANDMQFLLLIGRLSKCVFYFNGKSTLSEQFQHPIEKNTLSEQFQHPIEKNTLSEQFQHPIEKKHTVRTVPTSYRKKHTVRTVRTSYRKKRRRKYGNTVHMNVNAVFVRSFVIPFNKWRIEGVWCNRVVNLCLCSMLSIKHKWVKLDLWVQTPAPPLIDVFLPTQNNFNSLSFTL